jgi:spermidine/putrescine transport system permease protein
MRRFILIAVPYLWLLALFLVPFLIVLKISLSDIALSIPPYTPQLDLSAGWDGIKSFLSELVFENFTFLTHDPLYWKAYVSSLQIAAISTLLTLLVGYPIAYVIGVKLRNYPLLQALSLVLLIAPFFISFLLRTLAWKQIFSDEGLLVGVLKTFQLIPSDAYLTGTPFSVVFGLTYMFLPFMALPIYTTLEKLDLRYVEAGEDLYANPFTVFRTITFPLSIPGVISGTLLTFIPATGDYINASRDFLGSTDTAMMGNVIEANFLVLQNFPAAAALSLILMASILVLVSAYVRRSGTDDLL